MSEIDDILNGAPEHKQGAYSTKSIATEPTSEIEQALQNAPAPARGFGGWARDIAATAVKGAIAVPEAVVGLADIPTGGAVGKFLENEDGALGFRPKQAKEFVNEWHSDATKEAQRKFQEADGLGGKLQSAIENPSVIATAVGESIPSMLAGGVAARGLMAARGAMAANAAARAGLGEVAAAKAAEQAASKFAPLAGAAGEGLTMAGSAAEQIRQETNDGLLTPTQAGLAAATGAVGGAVGAFSGKLLHSRGIGDAETMLAQGANGIGADAVQQSALKSIPKAVVQGAITEGFLEELPQSVAEQVLQNLALDKDWTDGVDTAAVLGVLSGGAMGGGAAGLSGVMSRGVRKPEQPVQDQKQESPDQNTPSSGIDRIRKEYEARLSELSQQEAGEPQVAQSTPHDGRAILNAQEAAAKYARDAEMAANRAVQSPDDEIFQSTGATVPRSVQMGLNPAAGPMSAAAAAAVDTGAADRVQEQAAMAQAAKASEKIPASDLFDRKDAGKRVAHRVTGTMDGRPLTTMVMASSPEDAMAAVAKSSPGMVPVSAAPVTEPATPTATTGETTNGTAPTQAVQSQPQEAQAAAELGQPLTDTGTNMLGRGADPLQSIIQSQADASRAAVKPPRGILAKKAAADAKRKKANEQAAEPAAATPEAAAAPAPAVRGTGVSGGDQPQPLDALSGYEKAKAIRDAADSRVKRASESMQKYPRGAMGLTPDDVKASPQWKADKAEMDAAMRDLQNANATIAKNFAKEYRAEREAKRAAQTNVQDQPQGTQPQETAAPVEAPAPAGGDAAAAAGLPYSGASSGVREDGVEGYSLPEGDVWRDWRRSDKGNEHPEYEPSARQRVIMASVERAIDDGVFYNKEMTERVAKELGYTGLTDDGSVFKTDVYLARGTVEAKRKYANQTAIANELNLKAGDNLGTLIFNDFKVTTGVTVESVSKDGRDIKFTGKRGPTRVSAQTQPESIKAAIDRAHEKGKRKDAYAEFVASLQQAQRQEPAAPVATDVQADGVKAPVPEDRFGNMPDVSKNPKELNTSAEPAQKTEKSEQVEPRGVLAKMAEQKAKATRRKSEDIIDSRWESMNLSERERVAEAIGRKGIFAQKLAEKRWDRIDADVKSKLREMLDSMRPAKSQPAKVKESLTTGSPAADMTRAEMVQKGRDDFNAGVERQAGVKAAGYRFEEWLQGWNEAKDDAEAKAAGKVAVPSDFPLQEVSGSYSGISHSGGSRARSDRDAFVERVQYLYDEAKELAKTDAQQTALDQAIQTYKDEYIKQTLSLARVRSGTYSAFVAGRAKINTRQADSRNSALDKAIERFTAWDKEAAPRVKAAVLAARTADEVAAEQADKNAAQAAKQEKRQKSDMDLMRKILAAKGGEPLEIGGMVVSKVNNDKEGYPLTLTIKAKDGAALTNDKLNLATEVFGRRGVDGLRQGKEKIRALVDAIRAEGATTAAEPKAEPAQPASKTPTVDAHEALMKSVREGKATAEQFKAAFESLVENKAAVIAELETKTKAELLKAGGFYFQTRYANEKKADVASALYREILDEYVLGDGYSYGMGKNAKEDAVRRIVEATDDAKLEQYAKDRQAAIAEAQAERAAKAAAMDNPQTLADFKAIIAKHIGEGKSAKEAFLSLTPEQRIQFDTLAAESTREAREARKRERKTEVRAAGQTTGGEIIATKHTRDGYDLFVVKLADRLSKEDYSTVLSSAKKLGGWYSSFRGNGAIPGFQFKDRANAEAFLKLAGGDTTDAQAQAEQRRDAFEDDRSETAVERLRTMADKLTEQAAEIENADRKTNTARRARFAASALNGAAEMKAKASTMRNIAQAIEAGGAKFLDAVRTKSQVDMLTGIVATAKNNELRAKYPSYAEQEKRKGEPATSETADFAEFPAFTAYRSDLASLGRQLLEVDGTKKLGQRLMNVADDVSDAYTEFAKEPGNLLKLSTFSVKRGEEVRTAIFGNREQAEAAIKRSGLTGKAIVLAEKRGVNRIIMSQSEAINAGIWTGDGDKRITLSTDFGNELVEAIGRRGNKSNKLTVPWQFQNAYDRRKALSRMGIETPSEYRSALREFIGLQERAIANKVKEMELSMVGKKADGLDFFPTPDEVADQMVEAADIEAGMLVLEPSAGMGHIADRIRAAGAEPDVGEISEDRRELLEEKGYNIVARDFMEFTAPAERGFTFGDLMRAPDGTVGILRGQGGMGSDRVRLVSDEADPRELGKFNFSELEGVERRGSESGYDRIIMNPPFSNRRDAEHVQHAYRLLKPGGRIVAIMGEGVFFGKDKKAQDFRDWLDSVGGTNEKLPAGSFMDPSLPVNTGVNARMVVIDKPAGDAVTQDEDDAFMGEAESPVFYSALRREIEGLSTKSAPAVGWNMALQGLVKNGKVKADELEWTGISEWLKLQTGKVSKEDVLAYLDANGVQVTETVLGDTQGTFSFIATDGRRRTFTSMEEAQKEFDAEREWIEENAATIERIDDEIIVQDGNSQDLQTFTLQKDGTWEDQQGRVFDDEDAAMKAAEEVVTLEQEGLMEAMSREVEVDEAPNQSKYSQYTLPGGPLSRDTEILSRDGWIRMDEVQVGDIVMTRRDDDARLEWQEVEAVPTVYADKLYHFKNQSINMRVTACHNMLVKRRRRSSPDLFRVKAEELWSMSECIAPLVGKWHGNATTELYGYKPEDAAELIGWYIAEGSAVKENGKKSTLSIAQSRTANPEKCARLEALFDRMNIAWNYVASGPAYYLSIKTMDRGLVDVLHAQGDSRNKFVPGFIFDQPPSVLSRLMEGLLLGDGHLANTNHPTREPRWVYHSNCKQLADDMQLLALLTGLRAVISRRANGLYEVRLNSKQWASIDDAKHAIVDYNDTAYCVTVKNHAIYVRTGGVAAFTGNSNYREVLLTLPSKENVPVTYTVEQARSGDWVVKEDGKVVGNYGDDKALAESEAEDNRQRTKNGARELQKYRSSHWDQPNVLAHIRVNDRTDAQGRKVLFVEEIQSDWGQDGKKNGFAPSAKERSEIDAITREVDAAGGFANASPELQQRARVAGKRLTQSGIPIAPFVDKTDKWLALSLKRIMKMAVDGGYDAVAFVNGEQSAERFSLDKHLSLIEFAKAGPDNYRVKAYDINDGVVSNMPREMSSKQLEDHLGKEIAERIVKAERGSLEGEGLKVEAHGMRAFYDRIVPAAVKDVLKKVGGGQMEGVGIAAVENGLTVRPIDSPFGKFVVVDGNGKQVGLYETESEAKAYITQSAKPQPGFTITYSMREKVAGGLPLFAGSKSKSRGAGTPIDRAVMSMAGDGKSGNEILKYIANASRSPYRRQLAKALIATGANPDVSMGGDMGGGAGFKFLAKYSRKNHEVTLSEAAADRAEQIFLHETTHAATLLALDKRGLFATQMNRLYESAKKQGGADGQYGMKNVGEFVAEAFTNPTFQKTLKGMKAENGSLWERFVNIVRRILGMEQRHQDMLSAVLDAGVQVMRENMPLRAARSFRAEDGPAFSGVDEANFGIADAVEQIKAFDVKSAPKSAWAHYRGMALQALGRRQLVDLYAEELPQLETYNDLVQQMDAEKNDTGAEADRVAQDWGSLKGGMDRKLAELMHDATLAKMDPDKPMPAGYFKRDYDALKSRFDALSPEAKVLYRKARDMYLDHYNAVQQAIKDRVERSEMSEGQKRKMMADLDDKLFKELKGVYFPLARFGQYVIVVKDANGEVVNVTRAETVKEAEQARKELQKAFPVLMGNTVGKVLKQAEFNAGRDAVGKGFMADLMNTLDAKGVDDELRDTVAQLYLSSLPDLSWAKHGIHRKGTPGFSQDARRAFAQNMFHGARYLAKLRHADRLQDLLIEMQDHIKAYEGVEEYDSVQAQQVVDEMVKRHEWLMNPKASPVSTALTSFGFLFHMGLSPASAMVNLTQTALVAYPQMGAKWGFARAGAALTKASEETVRAKNDLSQVLKGDELDAFNSAVKDGTIDVTMAHDLAGIAQGEDQGVMWKVRPVMRWASFMFHHAEKFNRQATFLAAYRLAKEANPAATQSQLYEQAKQATYDGHFDYSACVDDATEILTATGWKMRKDLKAGDMAIATDASGRAVQSKVLAVNVYEGDREVIEFKSSTRFSMVLTPNHDAVIQSYNSRPKKWSAIRKVRADSIKNHHFILRTPLAPLEKIDGAYGEDFAALLGWVAAEGWYAKYRKTTAATDVRIGQSVTHNPEYVAEIRGILERLGGEFKEYTYERSLDVLTTFVLRRSLGRRIQECMPEKVLTPELVKSMGTSEMRAFLMAFLKGDGSRYENGRAWMVGQKNGANLDLLQAMATMCGMRSTLSPVNGNGLATLYVVPDDTGARSHVRPLEQIRRTEPLVWCPTTEHGTWIARRNGAVFVTGNSNRARIMQGNWQRVILLFKQYAQAMVYTLARNAYLSVKAMDPKERTQARKTLGGILAAHAAAAGVLGLPIVGPLLTVASWIGGDDDEPWDAEVAMQNAMAELLGPKAAEVMARGLSRLTPFDLSGRVALNKLILPDVQEGLEGKEWAESAMAAALGPVAGIGVNVARGVQKITEGDYLRGMEDMMPTALRGPLKALRYGSEGAIDKTGITITDEVGAAGVAGQALGLSPSQVRRDTERRSAIYAYDRALTERRSVLMRMFADAQMNGDTETAQEVRQDIAAFNEKNPTRRITVPNLMQSVRNRQRRIDQAEDGVYLPKNRRDALDAVAF